MEKWLQQRFVTCNAIIFSSWSKNDDLDELKWCWWCQIMFCFVFDCPFAAISPLEKHRIVAFICCIVLTLRHPRSWQEAVLRPWQLRCHFIRHVSTIKIFNCRIRAMEIILPLSRNKSLKSMRGINYYWRYDKMKSRALIKMEDDCKMQLENVLEKQLFNRR